MAGKTYYQSDRVLNLFLGSTVTGAAATYANLFVTNPTGDGQDGTEWLAGRVRVQQGFHATEPFWSSPQSEGNLRYVDNVRTVSWTMGAVGVYTANETVVGVGVWDASTGGNLLYWEAFDVSKTLSATEEIAFGTGALKVRED